MRLEGRVGLPLHDGALPTLLEGEQRLHLVEHLDAGRDADVDGVLAEDAEREAVQRGDGRDVELLERGAGTVGEDRVGTRRVVDEGLADAVAQFGGRGLGEGDGCELPERHLLVQHEPHDAGDERGGLAGAGAGLDEERLVDAVGGDAGADVLVDEPVGGGAHGAGTSSVSTPARRR
jgi:hypothetical protein